MENLNPHQVATDFLTAIDADWEELIQNVGACTFEPDKCQPYAALISSVAYQQLHPKAGDAILARFLALFEHQFPSPSQILNSELDALRSCGFSSRKIETIIEIAYATKSGLVPDRASAMKLNDTELINCLVQLKGIGRWTVEMFLIFSLGRMDILPTNDFGILQGFKRLKRLEHSPKPNELAEIGLNWQPYRSIASWYLWRVPK